MPALAFHFFGALELVCNDRSLPKPATLKSQSLLAYLVLNRQHPIPRDRLAGIYWGEWPESKARRSLTTSLWHIRRCLPEGEYLLTDAHSVQFNPQQNIWIDVNDFETLASCNSIDELHSCMRLYAGDFLDGFFDNWVIKERYRLQSLFSDVLMNLIVSLGKEGRFKETLVVARRLLDQDPLNEEGHRSLMRSYYQLGNRNQAINQFKLCQAIMLKELSVEPTGETTELYQDILKDRVAFHVPIVPPVIQTPVTVSKKPQGRDPLDAVAPSRMIEREKEIASLQSYWSAATFGKGGSILVNGEIGVGKTRLVEDFVMRLRRRDAQVLWGRCYEFERLLPYQPIAQALQEITGTLTCQELINFPAWVLVEISRLLPDILEKHPDISNNLVKNNDQDQGRLFDAVVRFLISLSTKMPLLLVIEDLHWAADSTLGLIHYLCRHIADQPIMLIGTMRSDVLENQHHLITMFQQLMKVTDVRVLNLKPLSQAGVEMLLADMSGAGDRIHPLARRLHQETEGNPFFLMETIKSLFGDNTLELAGGVWRGDFLSISKGHLPLPNGVKEVVLTRIRRLNKETQKMLTFSAVAGREFDFEVINEVWGRGEESTLEILEDLLRSRLIEEGKAGTERDYIFTHHKIQEVVYADLSHRQRAYIHTQVGLAMERIYKTDVVRLSGELAFHFEKSQPHEEQYAEKAIFYLLHAGDQARLLFAQKEAVDYYLRALSLLKVRGQFSQAARTYMKLGLTYHTSFNFKQAREAFEKGFALWEQAKKGRPAAETKIATHPLRMIWREPHSIDIARSFDTFSRVLIDQLFSGLVLMSPEMEILPDIAKSWDILMDGCLYIFHLREDVSWSDGTPLTAQDFEYSWKRLLDPATGFYFASLLYDIKGAQDFHQRRVADAKMVGIRAEDAHTLVVELEAPASYFLNIISLGIPLPRHILQKYGDKWTEIAHLVTNGPFLLAMWQPEQKMLLQRNPKYHGSFTGNVRVIELNFLQTHEWQEQLRLYEEDELDLLEITGFPPNEIANIRKLHADHYVSASAIMTYLFGFDQEQSPFHDKQVRQAFALAIDNEKLTDQLLEGYVFPATGGFIPPGMPGHTANIGLPYDPDHAQYLLSKAGYPKGAGFPTFDAIIVSNPTSAIISQYLQNQWKNILGLTSKWDMPATMEEFVERGYSQKPQLVALAWNADYPDPDNFLKVAFNHFQSVIHWQNPEYHSLIIRAGQVMDSKERLKLYHRAEQLLIQDAVLVPLYYSRRHILVKPWISKFPFSPIHEKNWKDIILDK